MHKEDGEWMAYIDEEVTAFCQAKGWGHQIRRKWSVRDRPVSESGIDDYEWKLLPGSRGRLPDAPPNDFDGRYYVLSYDQSRARFVFQHDTVHVGIWGSHWERETYTEFYVYEHAEKLRPQHSGRHTRRWPWQSGPPAYRPAAWLRERLDELTTRFGPNDFSIT